MTAAPSSPARGGHEQDGVGRAGHETPYERFLSAVVTAQVRRWLPPDPAWVLDISRSDRGRGSTSLTTALARCGHDVVRILAPSDATATADGCARHPSIRSVIGDARSLDWFRSERLDLVVAEGSALSSCLATETTVEEAARLLRPGGRLLLSVDSLLYGLARLAEQHRWPELADASAGDVVLVPADVTGPGESDDAAVTRCFTPEELHDLVAASGFDVDWVRPRTVIPPDVVNHAIERDPGVLPELIASELTLAQERQGESLGMYLTLSATRRD